MSEDLPIPRQDSRSDDAAVLEWGGPEPTPPGRVGRPLSRRGWDRGLPLVAAGLGAAAAFASLIGEWLVMIVPTGGPGGGTLRVPGGVSDVGGFGLGYLVGLFALVAAVALALRGSAAVRHDARVAGLALSTALVGVLVATSFSLDDSGQRTLLYSSEDGFQIEYGRGLWAAFVACALLAAALHLAGRADAGQPGVAVPRREDPPSRETGLPPAPADLTVQPTAPFARPE
ncbi:hypothetical protein MCAG_02799 [Micromonospora sp. ATCC 39149]|uniref:Uncharacterized protein n=1 Tax=Micromonospora carbonacea TaxID=47853 RepID=A0A7D6CE05_9ACTN|nr:hypothetical protein [Micromonospora sp. ATCC 39149]EEP72472.1 hypothetical protein MCAG_02799 [Micromonospora sp. ATCC 39149]QLJ98609.1 hypothetical protein HZU44_28930 [Micromonospora carbonacea]